MLNGTAMGFGIILHRMDKKRFLDYGKDVAAPRVEGRLDAPAFHRNKDAILNVLKAEVGARNPRILEIASGTGQHAAYFAEHWPRVTWWPSDLDPRQIESIDAWVRHAGVENVHPACFIDVASPAWRDGEPFDKWVRTFDAILAANMIHIARWQAATGLGRGLPVQRIEML